MIKNKKIINILIILPSIFILSVFLIAGYFIFRIFIDDPESKDYALYNQMHTLAKELYRYKQRNGNYPDNILRIRNTDNLCVKRIYDGCRKVYYKVSQDKKDFKMAMHSFTWPILYFHPKISFPPIDGHQQTDKETNKLQEKYGTVCYFCMAYPENEKNPNRELAPVYRKDPKIFSNPDDWPRL
ncbi:MAG: hypothetical protein Q7K55_09310 [Candidatus Levybacteria bacterium]|nr:hypothetical protein [Candidatus Levybacteria bacterium]